MSSTSFWLRVALGSAVVAVVGFAVYRAVGRLKWSTASQAPFFHHSSSVAEKTKTWQHQLFLFEAPGKPSTNRRHERHPALWVARLPDLTEKWDLSDHIDAAVLSSFLPYSVQTGALSEGTMQETSWSSVTCHCWDFTQMQCFVSLTLNYAKWLRLENQRAAHEFIIFILFYFHQTHRLSPYISC